MQPTKDSFYLALRDRLTDLNPQRLITVNGITRPAIIVAENELVIPVDPQPDTFYIEWGASQLLDRNEALRPLLGMECVVSYHTAGTVESGVDRGRTLAELDTELLSICEPRNTVKKDFTRSPNVDLGTNVFWTTPVLSEITSGNPRRQGAVDSRLERKATLKVFFFPEVNLP